MSRVSMTASVSMARAMLILSACLILGTLIGLLPHSTGSSGQHLRQPQQQEAKTTSGSGVGRAQLQDTSLLGGAAWPEQDKEADVKEANEYVWTGEFANMQQQALDTVELSMEFSFEFGGSFSYDYYY